VIGNGAVFGYGCAGGAFTAAFTLVLPELRRVMKAPREKIGWSGARGFAFLGTMVILSGAGGIAALIFGADSMGEAPFHGLLGEALLSALLLAHERGTKGNGTNT
jgi:hypothetical protein